MKTAVKTTVATSNTIKVKIYGREYPLRCDENSERVLQIAELVDAKMRTIAQNTSLSSHSDIAVLAALNLTHELLVDQIGDKASATNSDEFSNRAQELLLKLEQSLPDLEPAMGE